MKRKILSLALALALVISLMPSLGISASAASSGTEMDALTALGIDSSTAPEGYDANSLDNPYGRNTVELAPVYELYKVGLSAVTGSSASYNTTSTIQNGGTTQAHSTVYDNSLTSSLYGNEAWSATTVGGILGAASNAKIADGTTTTDGSYTLISTGEVYKEGATPTTSTACLDTATNIPATGYLKDATNASTNLGGSFKYALSSVAAGNFDKNTGGLAAQTAMVYTSDYSTNGGLYLCFGSATSGAYGTGAKELLSTAKQIGNPTLTYESKLVENFAEAPYQLQNYLQVTTGDWNGDGVDEVAVYIPEKGNSRIAVYALQLTDADNKSTAYLNPSKWQLVWTYSLREVAVVSNMVSLVSGDVNQDGTDDLAATWGYYYGPTQNEGSKAVVMFGAKGTELLKTSQQFDLTYGSSNIVRASFDFGDMAGSDEDVLILCGQSDADLKAGNTQTRYVALYDWNGTTFISNVYQNFDLFEHEGTDYTWDVMMARGDKFYSLPLCTANTGVISQGVSGGGDLLYFDSLLIEYTENGLSIKEAWDNTGAMQQNPSSCVDYVEYGAVAGDLTGQTGAGALVTMTQTLSSSAKNTASYTFTGHHQEPVYVWDYYYQNWLYKLFSIKTWYLRFDHYDDVSTSGPVSVDYEQLTMGKTVMVAADPAADYYSRTAADFSTSICLANTDNDSSYMNYGGIHYYTYTDPEVLAVLASPPYFKDLMNRDDLSGGYAQSTTSYSSTTGSGSGYDVSATISLGAYISFEQDIEVFGVKIASVEAEATMMRNFTFEMEKTSTLEQTVTYAATSGEDMVAFYSIPMEIYEYESYVADGLGGYKKVLTTVNVPHEAAVRLLSLAEYEDIAKDYSVLPTIADNVLTHVLGDPSSYPVGTDGYRAIAEYKGTPAAVGFSSAASGSGIAQEIAMSTETNTAFSMSASIEAKAGAGAGGFKVGVIAGAEVGAGVVLISTNGNSFSGEMQNMPIEAQPFGYGMNWRIFCYEYSDGGTSFPVVSYIVSDVSSPPPLPDDFKQDMAETTSDSVVLTWSYDRTVAGFRIYRYYEFPEGSGSYEVEFVPFSAAVSVDRVSGTYYFNYKDENLSPYTEYKYQIKTVRADNPKESIYSQPMSCRTKTTVGYPSITLGGLDENGQLPIYPDDNSVVSVSIADAVDYTGISYQWQKLVDGTWTEISGRVDKTLTISNAGTADKGTYRCRVNCIYYDEGAAQNYYISAYSAEFATAYAKRTPKASIFTAEERITDGTGGIQLDGLLANIELHSAIANHAAAPTGNVTFTVKGTDYDYSETVALDASLNTKFLDGMERKYATASLSIESLPVGVYSVTAYYGGSKVFQDMTTTEKALVVIGRGSADRLDLAAAAGGSAVTKFVYGNAIHPTLFTIAKALDGKITETSVDALYKYYSNDPADWDIPTTPAIEAQPIRSDFTAGSPTPNVGSYTMEAYVGGELKAAQTFTVGQKPITVSVMSQPNVDAGKVSEHPPQLVCAELTDALAALNLSYLATNSAGNLITLDNATEPGNYTVTACVGRSTDAVLYNNYSVTYVSGIYTIIGATFELIVKAAPYTDKAGTRPVGTVGISNKTQTPKTDDSAVYAANTAVVLYAAAEDSYEVDTWTAVFEDTTIKTQDGRNTFTLSTQAQKVTVTATFKPATITLEAIAQPGSGGVVSCSDEYFSSGAYVSTGAEYTFTATPKAGYHFNKWQTLTGGTTASPAGTATADGSNTLNVTIGTASMTVYAYFSRDSYTLTLDGDISASFMFDDDGNLNTPLVKRNIPSGASVAGDTAVTLEPKTGYQAAGVAVFIVNGTATTDSARHVFNITQNTTVSLDTVRNNYAVTVSAVNGSVVSKVNGVTASVEDLATVEGGSALTFIAHADRGFVFDHWMLNDVAVPNSTETLTIAELGATTSVTAVFTANVPYPATAVVNTTSRGTMKYTLFDIYGDLVGTALTDMPVGTSLTVYKDEKIVLTVAVNSGNMIEQWEVNGTNSYTSQKTYTVDKIGAAINAKAYLKAASSYSVNFIAMGTTGSTLTAKADDIAIATGTLQYGGSSLAFSATPASDYMLDYWTITAGETTVAENGKTLDSDGKTMIAPVFHIDPLKQNLTVRAHFTTLATNAVTLPSTTMGVSAITYITPIAPTDNGTRNVATENVRTGGTVIMTFTPAAHYGTNAAKIKTAIEGKLLGTDAIVFVEENAGVFTATIKNLQSPISLIDSELYYHLYSIIVPEHVTVSSASAKAGDTVTLTVTPASSYILSSLTVKDSLNADIALNETVNSSKLSYTFTMPAHDVSVEAKFTFVAPPVPGPSGGGTGEKQTIPATGGGITVNISVTVAQGLATLEMGADTLEDLSSFSGILSFDLSALKDVTGVNIPASAFGVITGAVGVEGLSVKLPAAGVTFDSAALAAIGAAGSGDVTLTAVVLDTSTLTEEQQALVGDREVIDLTLNVGSKTVSDFGSGTVEVKVPYTLKPGESEDAVVVWYLNDKGILESVTGRFDTASGSVVFETGHFSKYVIGSLPFDDVAREKWFFESVSFVYANGLFSGTGDLTFEPNTYMTRAMLVTVLWRLDGEPAEGQYSGFADVAEDKWYSEAVTWAAKNNIVSGLGNGIFAPDGIITREQIAVIMMNYTDYKHYSKAAPANLGSYYDSQNVSTWAMSAMQWANAEGLINGIGNNLLSPKVSAERCQVAAILQRFVADVVE